MYDFITNITSFPVVVYTFLMSIIVVYWLLALLGALDIEMFDGDIEIETGLDIDTDTEIESEGLSGVTGFMAKWGLTGVPVTVVVSVLIVTSWLICYILASLLLPIIPFAIIKTIASIAMILLSFALSIPATAKLIQPLKKAFVSHTAAKKSSFIGCECIVKTGKVNETFGQAVYEDGGAGMLFDIRADTTAGIKKGDSVVLKSYNEDEESYSVIKTENID